MKVILHSNEESAANATDTTLKMIPMGGNAHLKRDQNGDIEYDGNGHAFIETENPRFIEFTLKSQGYVKEVIGTNE